MSLIASYNFYITQIYINNIIRSKTHQKLIYKVEIIKKWSEILVDVFINAHNSNDY